MASFRRILTLGIVLGFASFSPAQRLLEHLGRGLVAVAQPDGKAFLSWRLLGTDPEAYLMLEARAGREGPEWQFAFAPQTSYALKASWTGREVWSVPDRKPWTATEPFFGRTYRPSE